MTIAGILLLIAFLICIVMILKTSRIDCFPSFLWLAAPILHVTKKYGGIAVDPFVLGLCLMMFCISFLPILKVKVWRVHMHRGNKILRFIAFAFSALLIGYCIYHSSAYNWLTKCYFALSEKKDAAAYAVVIGKGLVFVFALFLAVWGTGEEVLRFIDRFIGKRDKFVVLKCKTFYRRRIFKRYFLEGINNGRKYLFRVAPSVYWNLKKSETLLLPAVLGCAGGIYCLTSPVVQKRKIVRRRKERK